jgi:predicted transcriptional regulator
MTKIYKITNNGKKTWVVEFQDYTIKKTVTFVLDAIDGTILNKTENNLPVRICGDSQN